MSAKTSTLKALAQVLSSGEYSDLKLVCQGEEFKVHKVIVCPQSPVIAAALNGSFQEATTNVINIFEFDAWTVKQMIGFMYGEEGYAVEDPDLPPLPLNEVGLRHVQMNAIADYYNIPQLRELANNKIKGLLEKHWSNIDPPAIVNKVFDSTSDKDLHGIIHSTIAEHILELTKNQNLGAIKILNGSAINILYEVVPRYEAQLEGLRDTNQLVLARIESLENENRREKTLHQAENASKQYIIDNIKSCVRQLNEIKTCRKCNAMVGNPYGNISYSSFGNYATASSTTNTTVQCSKCGINHA